MSDDEKKSPKSPKKEKKEKKKKHREHEYKLTYFDVKGRGERVRLVFAYLGCAYEDHRIDGPTFGQMKAGGEFPFGSVPSLTVDGKDKIANSVAICSYLAKEHGDKKFFPKHAMTNGWAHSISNTTEDRFASFVTIHFTPEEGKKEAIEKEMPKSDAFIKSLSKIIGDGYVAGDDFTFADCIAWDYIDQAEPYLKTKTAAGADPNLKNWMEKVENQPGIKEYLAGRK